MHKKNVMIVLAGDIEKIELKKEIIKNEIDYVVAVDGGYDTLRSQGVKIDLIIGDLDSIKAPYDEMKIIKYSQKKDYSDFNLAIKYVRENLNSCKSFVYGFVSCTRLDHVLFNISEIEEDVILISYNQKIEKIKKKVTNAISNNYAYYSFFALEEVSNLNLEGFEYPLIDYNLKSFDPLCLSNKILKEEAKVYYEEGKLIMISSKCN